MNFCFITHSYAQIVKYSQNVPMDKEYFVDVKDAFTAIKYASPIIHAMLSHNYIAKEKKSCPTITPRFEEHK